MMRSLPCAAAALVLAACDPVASSTITLAPRPASASAATVVATSADSGAARADRAAALGAIAALAPRFGYAEGPGPRPQRAGCERSWYYTGPEIAPDACVPPAAPGEVVRVSFWIFGAFRIPPPSAAFRDAVADSLRAHGRVTVGR